MLYRIIIQSFPRLLYLSSKKIKSGQPYYTKDDYFKEQDIGSKSYDYLKKYSRFLIPKDECANLRGIFSPLGIVTGMSIYKVVRTMGVPHHFICNRKIMKDYCTVFYKKQIGGLKCVFQLHFHKRKLFLYQASINETSKHGYDLIELLLGEYLTAADKQNYNPEKINYFKDEIGNYVCATSEFFGTRFTLVSSHNNSFEQLLEIKYDLAKSKRKDIAKTYNHAFVKATI